MARMLEQTRSPVRRRYTLITQQLRDEAVRLYCDEYLPVYKVSQQLGIGLAAVRDSLKLAGVVISLGGKRTGTYKYGTAHWRLYVDTNGYEQLRWAWMGQAGGIPVHRLVMEEFLGRSLVKGETVHHRNGVRTDNRINNLELWATPQPAGQRPSDLVAWAREILDRYEEDVRQQRVA